MTEKIISFIRDACALDENNITLATKLQELSLDSLSFIEALVKIEQEFDIEFGIEEFDWTFWETVGDLILNIQFKINKI